MEDTNLFVNYETLNSDGEILINQSNVIQTNIADIKQLISNDWSSWIGEDNGEYVKSLKNFLQNLSYFNTELSRIGNFMQKMSSKYSSQVAANLGGIENNG